MLDVILNNELYKNLINLGVFLLPFIIAGVHFKRYNFLQGIFSLICLPMITVGVIDLIKFIKLDQKLIDYILSFKELFMPYFNIHKNIYKLTNWEWLYNSSWIFMPSIVLYFLTLGYSITARSKRKKREKSN